MVFRRPLAKQAFDHRIILIGKEPTLNDYERGYLWVGFGALVLGGVVWIMS